MASSERKHLQLLVLLWLLLAGGLAMAASQLVESECVRSCGDVSIPYPFGTTKDCYYNEDFFIYCDNRSSPHVPSLWATSNGIGVIDISLAGQLRIRTSVVADCYDEQTGEKKPLAGSGTFLRAFPFSYTRNKFTAIGCDTSARFQGVDDPSRQTGCMSLCSSDDNFTNGDCSGVGCCQTRIPKGVLKYTVLVYSLWNHTYVPQFNPCGFAFLVEEESYNFSTADFRSFQNKTNVPTVLDWAIGNKTCEQARQNTTSFACKENSYCNNSDNGPGYRCFCSQGYEGNPYLSNNCTDIDECKDSNLNDCIDNMCVNVEGGYNCTCPLGQDGDGKRKNGSSCIVVDKCLNGEGKGGDGCNSDSFAIKISVGIGIGFLVLLIGSGWLFWGIKSRKLRKLKEHFFQNNGGLLLEQLCGRERSTNPTKIFSAEELEKATNNYSEDMIVGLGGFGTVYKGIFSNNSIVAIKKSKVVDQSQIEQFINEVFILSQINHRNVVKLLGCCLETEVPLLVYEFIPNGTLFEHIHDESKTLYLSWDMRLRIAAETAGVLAYLHSATSTPIIHRDIKSTNILLDENYTSKVSDFGASRLVPLDEAQITTMVQGTLGYLDPEYLHTSQLTDKSDVYSFGVVLVELLTGKKAICFKRPEDERCLAMYFVSSLKDDRLFLHILDDHLVNDGNIEQLKEVSNLAMRCLRVKGEERPSMKEVAMELEGIMRKIVKHSWDNLGLNSEETECLLGEKSDSTSAGYDSIKDHLPIPIGDGR